ncbi:retinoblastoma-like protein 1 isoform X2 [Phascolarctos cinereus]|uniref:Retinoblastoma-like protein 1 isoform X2 n=1 Tax=Phascolarctos cinereus TaxID=38626 RepID=A0A6P5KLI9_PHACI|nr:retinoblastoma-like protein 1 isoform X2 [Phascolarctos cinereus]
MFQDELHGLGAAGLGAARQALQALCQELNLDEGSAAEALGDFMAIRSTYSLEGEVVHWLACALYVACRKSIIPTVGKGIMEGNCVSLTRILRSAKLRNPYEEPPKLPRSRKQRRVPCTVKDLFNFCWTLFVYTKGNFRMIGDDLVNSYHLLLCCLDLTFTNAIMCPNRRDLLNLSFKGLPPDFHTSDYRASEEPPCIIAALCELHDGLLVEAKGIKEHYFKPYISKLFDRKILKGECLLDISSFADNSKAVNKEYEEYVLTVGDFDERVFLGADAEEEIGSPQKFIGDTPAGKLITRVQVECNLQQHFAKERSFAPSTPLTGRRYLQEKEAATTPVASATQSVSRLQNIVAGLKNAPSEQLVNIFESCVRNPMENIMNIVKSIGEAFCQHYTQSTDEQPGSHIDFAVNRLKLAEILYYKILETVMVQETRRHHGMDMSVLLEQDIFHRSLMACCLEIVLFAYSSPRSFPWIIEVLDLSPFYFYKVIEVLIRSEEGLSRDTIKHLNSIEEQILESLAWSNDSALWDALHISENKVPTCEEVIFPNNLEMGNVQGHLPMMPLSPIVHPRVKEVRTDSGNLRRDVQPLSPISVHERYSSPTAGSAKRRLFGEDTSSKMFVDKTATEGTKLKIASSSSVIAENVSVLPGQSLLTVAPAVVAGTTGQRVTIPLHGVAIDTGGITVIPMPVNASEQSRVESPVQIPITAQSLSGTSPKQSHGTKALEMHQAGVSRPKRTGSLALFYRKVYHLASVRLRDLCLKLDISNDLRRKIWTCFEFTLVHCFDLMKDRHLDQLLLCAFYIMAKVTKEERTFQDIMKSYRNQPQANSHVYRSVLLKRIPREVSTCNKNVKDTEMADYDLDCAKIPDCSTGAMKEERGDLIKFYNEVYIGRVKSFALKYDLSNEDHVMEAPPLSPFPNIKQQPVSPRRISQQHSVYVSPHQNGTCLTPRTALLYRFNGSPSKSLKDINNMIKYGEQRSKKRALTIDGDTQSPTKRLCQENDDVLLKRLQDVVSERANH